MRILVVSDFHSNERFNQVYDFLKKDKFIDKCKIDKIIVNGNMIGITELAPGYGYKYKKDNFFWDLNKKKLFLDIAPKTAKNFVEAINDKNFVKNRTNLTKLAKAFAEERYTWILTSLRKLSKIKHTYFNFGTLESPLHFFVMDELAMILGLNPSEVKDKIEEEEIQEVFSQFKKKLEQLDADERFTYISLKTVEHDEILFVGVPGITDSDDEEDSQTQEKLTLEMLVEIRNKLHGTKGIIICNNVQGITSAKPFHFVPGSEAMRAFIEQMKTEQLTKVFIQSHRHFMTTHFYKEKNWHFVLNNSAVNNGLFNIIEFKKDEVTCWDVDPSTGEVLALEEYDKDKIEYETPEERLALNYAVPKDIIEHRRIKDCDHM